MREVIINGKFYSDNMQGIVRYGRELVPEIDKLLSKKDSVILAVPHNAKNIPKLNHIKTVKIGKRTGIKWEMLDLSRFVRKHKKAICLNFCNITPFFVQPGITVVHDIMYKVLPENYTTFRNKASRLWHILQYRYIMSHEKCIITVSKFSKKDIEKHYPSARGKVHVVSSAWQHVLKFKESPDWQERYPFLKPKDFMFSLSQLSKNKNGKWIIEAAKHNPNITFAMAGKMYETEYTDIPENVHMLGFVSDEDACSLMKKCRAFLFPSLYEGFGLPPLEALALGADIIVSNSTSLPEVYGDCAHYIDPMNYDVDFYSILNETVKDRNDVLNKYSFEKSAKMIYDIICKL